MNTQQLQATKIASLTFAHGQVGQRYPLTTAEAESEHARQLAAHNLPLTKTNTADCGDDRPTIGLADGTNDPEILVHRVVTQLFGGLGLATTKAVVAADAAVVKDAVNMWQAYEIVSGLLSDKMGEEDAGHVGCGASNSVESSVANPIPVEILVPSVGLFVPPSEAPEALVRQNVLTKESRLQDGFYSGWDPAKHIDYLTTRFPQNFSYLDEDPHDQETAGHKGSSLYVVTSEGRGFAKNAFNRDTGQQAFSVSLAKMRQLAFMLGGSQEERARILIGFADDTLHVGAGIVAAGMPVFAEQE